MLLTKAINIASNAPGQDLLLKPILHSISLVKYVYTSHLVCYVLTYLTYVTFSWSQSSLAITLTSTVHPMLPKGHYVKERRNHLIVFPWFHFSCPVQVCSNARVGNMRHITASSGSPTSVPKIALMSSGLFCLLGVSGESKLVTANGLMLACQRKRT